jgi:hypothetical protein
MAVAKVRITLRHSGVLGAFGYSKIAQTAAKRRREALDAAAAAKGWAYIVRRLNVLYIFNKHRHAALAAKFRADRNYASSKLRQAALR